MSSSLHRLCRQYDRQLQEEEAAARSGSVGSSSDAGRSVGKELDMPCRACGGSHVAKMTEIAASSGRYCVKCNTLHAANHGDCWIDKQGGFFARMRVYVCFHGVVLDITDYARCNRMLHNAQVGGQGGKELHPVAAMVTTDVVNSRPGSLFCFVFHILNPLFCAERGGGGKHLPCAVQIWHGEREDRWRQRGAGRKGWRKGQGQGERQTALGKRVCQTRRSNMVVPGIFYSL